MVTALIGNPLPKTSEAGVPLPHRQLHPKTRRASNRQATSLAGPDLTSLEQPEPTDPTGGEVRYVLGLFFTLFTVTLLPMLLLLLYLIWNPDGLQYDATPQGDWSSWHPG